MASGTINNPPIAWKLLWENPNPNSSFSPQTVSIPGASAYSLFLCSFTQAPNVGGYGQYNAFVPVQDIQVYGQHVGKDIRRDTQMSNAVNDQCIFGKGQIFNSYGSATDDNSKMIPYRIYGVL